MRGIKNTNLTYFLFFNKISSFNSRFINRTNSHVYPSNSTTIIMKFKAVVFDFGNVIINIDVPRTFQSFASLTGKNQSIIERQIADSQLFRRYETGQFEDDEFREIVRQTLGFPLSDRDIDLAWNSLLLDIPKERISLLNQIRAKYPVYLLSNTNHIHIQASNYYIKRNFNGEKLIDWFDKLYLSYEMGLWKPEKAIYQTVLNDLSLSANEVLFLDDNKANIESAAEMGIQTILVEPSKSINHYFSEFRW
jgi:glucose-1-phosphatase